MSTTNIEKQSLEAHVELCAERYKTLNDKLDTVGNRVTDVEQKFDKKMEAVEKALGDIKNMIMCMQNSRNRQLIAWGSSVIAVLAGAVGSLLWYIIK
jgi:acetate kinase